MFSKPYSQYPVQARAYMHSCLSLVVVFVDTKACDLLATICDMRDKKKFVLFCIYFAPEPLCPDTCQDNHLNRLLGVLLVLLRM